MDCKDGKELISLYLAGDLSQEKMAQLAQHISVCAKCKKEFEDAKHFELSLKEALLLTAQKMRSPKSRVLKTIEPEAKKRRRRAKFISIYLFVLVALASLCLVLLLAYAGILAISRARMAQQKELASSEIRLLTSAIHLYQNDYGERPLDGNANLVLALSAKRKDKPDFTYYVFPPKRLKNEQFLDPWGTPYIYVRTETGFLIYSAGPNRKDDIRSGDDISR
jgi:type II secretory pathway pseudopilin PulG